jgi:hypothetical protein
MILLSVVYCRPAHYCKALLVLLLIPGSFTHPSTISQHALMFTKPVTVLTVPLCLLLFLLLNAVSLLTDKHSRGRL